MRLRETNVSGVGHNNDSEKRTSATPWPVEEWTPRHAHAILSMSPDATPPVGEQQGVFKETVRDEPKGDMDEEHAGDGYQLLEWSILGGQAS